MVEYREATDYRGQFWQRFYRHSDWLLNAMVPRGFEIRISKNDIFTNRQEETGFDEVEILKDCYLTQGIDAELEEIKSLFQIKNAEFKRLKKQLAEAQSMLTAGQRLWNEASPEDGIWYGGNTA